MKAFNQITEELNNILNEKNVELANNAEKDAFVKETQPTIKEILQKMIKKTCRQSALII